MALKSRDTLLGNSKRWPESQSIIVLNLTYVAIADINYGDTLVAGESG